MMQIILASSSQNRQEIFRIAEIPVQIMPAGVDEKSVMEPNFEKRAIAIASLKARQVYQTMDLSAFSQGAVVIAGDGFNVVDNQIFEKPKDREQAKVMLRQLSGNVTTFYSGLMMIHTLKQEEFVSVVSTKAWFRLLSESEINDYVEQVDTTQYAAAYSPLNTKAISFIIQVEGSLSGFSHSVPMDVVVSKLTEWGAL